MVIIFSLSTNFKIRSFVSLPINLVGTQKLPRYTNFGNQLISIIDAYILEREMDLWYLVSLEWFGDSRISGGFTGGWSRDRHDYFTLNQRMAFESTLFMEGE